MENRIVGNENIQKILDRISVLVKEKMKAYKVVGASISIVDGDNTLHSEGYGYADLAHKLPVTSETIFKIGSITKVFTAAAIMKLFEQGKVDIDKPVKEYISEFSVGSRFPNAKPITTRDILCHHSGLPCDNLKNYFSSDPEAYKSLLDYLPTTYLVSPPGKMFYYSNLGMDLLGIIIERSTGMPYYQYMETVLLKDLDMDNSAIVLPEEWESKLSKAYHKFNEQKEDLLKEVPSGGIYSSAIDMAKFMKSALNGGKEIFRKENTLDSMFTPQYQNNPIDFNMNNGLGWFIGKPGLDHSGKVVWHDGGTPNFFSLTVIIPERKLGLTILTNSSSGAQMNHRISIDI